MDITDSNIILTGPVGEGIYNKMNKKPLFIENYMDVYDLAVKNNMNLLFIYRSDYRKLSTR